MTVIRISQAGGCPRRIALEARGVEGLPISEATKRAFAEGNLHEADILEWMREHLGAQWLWGQQKEVRIGDKIVGHVDAIARLDEHNHVLLEAKCLSARAFQEFRSVGLRQSHPQYFVQVQLYLHALATADNRYHVERFLLHTIDTAYLVARNKETPKTRLWDHHYEKIVYDPEFCKHEVEYLLDLGEAIERGDDIPIPEGYHPDSEWHCRPRWCPYTFVCHPDWRPKRSEAVQMDELADTVEQYQSLTEQINELTAARDELKERLLASLSPGTTVQAGDYVLSCVERRTERFDTKKARQILTPDLLKELLTVSTSTILKIQEVG